MTTPEGNTSANGESRNAKFRRLAELRASRIVRDLEMLANLSTNNYHYSKTEVDELFAAIAKVMMASKAKFDDRLTRGDKKPTGFVFT